MINVGQLYLHDELNEYMIVTSYNRGYVSYEGPGFSGRSDSEEFLECFLPVNPEDVSPEEVNYLKSFCPAGTVVTTGFIK